MVNNGARPPGAAPRYVPSSHNKLELAEDIRKSPPVMWGGFFRQDT